MGLRDTRCLSSNSFSQLLLYESCACMLFNARDQDQCCDRLKIFLRISDKYVPFRRLNLKLARPPASVYCDIACNMGMIRCSVLVSLAHAFWSRHLHARAYRLKMLLKTECAHQCRSSPAIAVTRS